MAATVIVCSLIVLAALTLALTDITLLTPERERQIDFASVTGIRVNSQLRYAGAPAGRVTGIRILSHEEKMQAAAEGRKEANVRVTVAIDKGIPELTDGLRATIESDSLLSEKFVNLNPGPLDAPALANTAIIDGSRAISLNEVIDAGYQAISRVDEILEDLREKNPDLGENIHSVITDVRQLTAKGSDLVSKTNTLLDDNSAKISRLLDNADRLTSSLKVTADNLKVVSTYAKSLMYTLADKPWRLIWGGKTPPLPPEEEILRSSQPVPIATPPPGPGK
ncbi:MAG: MlaD family protein [Verrucomicrobiia bacterium]